jgi:hypothetical protein
LARLYESINATVSSSRRWSMQLRSNTCLRGGACLHTLPRDVAFAKCKSPRNEAERIATSPAAAWSERYARTLVRPLLPVRLGARLSRRSGVSGSVTRGPTRCGLHAISAAVALSLSEDSRVWQAFDPVPHCCSGFWLEQSNGLIGEVTWNRADW